MGRWVGRWVGRGGKGVKREMGDFKYDFWECMDGLGRVRHESRDTMQGNRTRGRKVSMHHQSRKFSDNLHSKLTWVF